LAAEASWPVPQRAGWKACTTFFHINHHILRDTMKYEDRTVAAAPNNAFSGHRPLFLYKFFLIDHVQDKRWPRAALCHYR